MEKEKVKKIKKALENCTSEIPCYKCKYYGKCEKLLTKENILNLINELETEVTGLKYELQKVHKETAKEIIKFVETLKVDEDGRHEWRDWHNDSIDRVALKLKQKFINDVEVNE